MDKQSFYDYFQQAPLFPVEKAVSTLLGVDPNLYSYVSERPSQFGFEDSTPESKGYEGALRHLLLAGELERRNPRVAGPLLYGHEFLSGTLYGQPAEYREMDLYNNMLGRELGRQAKSREHLELLALTNLHRARTVPPPPSPFGFGSR